MDGSVERRTFGWKDTLLALRLWCLLLAILALGLRILLVKLAAKTHDFTLACEEDENGTGWQTRVNLAHLLERLLHVIGLGAARKVNSHRVLASTNVDDGRWGREESRILSKVGHAQGGRHDDNAQRAELILAVARLTPALLTKLGNA